MIYLKLTRNVLEPEVIEAIPYQPMTSIWSILPDDVRNSNGVFQVTCGREEFDDDSLRGTFLSDGAVVSVKAIPRAPVGATPAAIAAQAAVGEFILGIGLPLFLGFSAQALLRLLDKKPRTPRGDRLDSANYGFDLPQMTTANGSPIQIAYGRIRLSGMLLSIRTINELAPDNSNISKIVMLLGLGEGGEEGWESIGGISDDTSTGLIPAINFENLLFINDNPASQFEFVNVGVRLGKKHQAPIPGQEIAVIKQSIQDRTLSHYGDPSGLQFISTGATERFTFDESFTYTTDNNVDGFIVDVTIDFMYFQGKFNFVLGWGDWAVDWRLNGASTWTDTRNVHVDNLVASPIVVQTRVDGLKKARYDIRVRPRRAHAHFRPDLAETQALEDLLFFEMSFRGNVFFLKLRVTGIEEILQEVFTYPNKALLSIEGVASEQLSGSQPSVSVIAECMKIRVYTDTSTYTTIYSNNPAWVLLDLLTNTRYGLGQVINIAADVEIQTFIDAAAYCDVLIDDGNGNLVKRFECNIVIDKRQDAWEWVYTIAKTANLSVFKAGGKYRVKADQGQTSIMMFTPGNMANFSMGYFPVRERVNYLETTFRNEADEFREDLGLSLDETITDLNQYVKESGEILGVTRRDQVIRLGNFRINSSRLLIRYARWDADLPTIRCEPADVVDVAYDAIFWGTSAGLVRTATTTAVRLDKPVILESGKTYKIKVFHVGGTFEELFVASPAGTTETITLSGTFAVTPAVNSPYTIGEVTNLLKQFKIIDISRTEDNRAQVFAIEHNPLVYSETIQNPQLAITNIGFLPSDFPPDVTNLTLTERQVVLSDGTLSSAFDVAFTLPISTIYSHADIWIGMEGGSSNMPNGVFNNFPTRVIWGDKPVERGIRGSHVELKNTFEIGTKIYVAVTSNSIFGISRKPQESPSVSLVVQGKTLRPADVTGFRVTRLENNLTFTWNPVADLDLKGYEIRTGDTWEGSFVLGTDINFTKFQTNLFFTDPNVATTQKFLIKAIDTTGNYSTNAASLVITVEPRFGVDVYVSRDEKALTWPGTKVNTTVNGSTELELNAGQQEGTYETPDIDGTVIARMRVMIFIQSQQINNALTWDLATFTWDSIEAQNLTWDGPVGVDNFSVLVESKYGSTLGALAAATYQPFIPEETTFRYAKFKLTLSTLDTTFSGKVTAFKMSLDAIEIFDSKKNISMALATENPKTISFNSNVTFHNDSVGVPSISLQVTVQDLGNGERVKVTAKTLTTFTIEIRDSAGSLVTTGTRTVDYIATGF